MKPSGPFIVPPPGYLTTTEQYRIRGIGSEPAPGNLVQTINCTTSFKLFYQKNQGQTKPTWKAIPYGKKFKIEIAVDSMNFEAFQKAVADACDKQFSNAGKIIEDAVECGFPHLDWIVIMNLRDAAEFKRAENYTVNDQQSYAHWMATVVDNARDRTEAWLELKMVNPTEVQRQATAANEVQEHVLTTQAAKDAASASKRKAPNDAGPGGEGIQKWAKAIMDKVPGVSMYTPPGDFKFEQLSKKKRKLDNNTAGHSRTSSCDPNVSIIIPNPDLVRSYVEFVKINPSKKEAVLKALDDNDITHPRFFLSKNITHECMSRWGLSDGIIAQLKDNVNQFLELNN
ncbi:hypothetical protein PTTG_29073 [Puccinia triticina 1-1 BBBD Race 1]|uniref:Uncharacterized protein n=1 Tax=Puccinia triticina (isolate 1-1 / race 1 (BBBD)) TaxID=630390 RepID=A0A180G6R2_PUCT1|nr:hypothetical protein PTTG_29073 [Puccinia triticina 1-1 BBBD Race 1]